MSSWCSACPYHRTEPVHVHPYWREQEWEPIDFEARTNKLSVRYVAGHFSRYIRHIIWQWDQGILLNIYGIDAGDELTIEWKHENITDSMMVSTGALVDPNKSADTDDPDADSDTDPDGQDGDSGVDDDTESGETEQADKYYEIAIPDEMLQVAGKLTGYMVMRPADGAYVTVGLIVITVNERDRYVSESDPEPTCEEKCEAAHEDLQAQIEALKATIQELIDAMHTDDPDDP